jgi:hypothetical protein
MQATISKNRNTKTEHKTTRQQGDIFRKMGQQEPHPKTITTCKTKD